MITTVIKQPAETLHASVAFATPVPIATVLGVTVARRGLVPGAIAMSATARIVSGAVALALSSGTDGERYAVTVRARDTDDAELESEVEVAVIETAWQLPDGGAPYLSIVDFVRRFGLDEVVRMTDADGSGRIDRDLLIGALTDGQAIAEAHLADRYTLPLGAVPRIIGMAIADIARARLYPRGAPEGIDAAAKNAIRTFERIQTGQLTLGLPAADVPAASVSDTPILVAPGRRQYSDGLADY